MEVVSKMKNIIRLLVVPWYLFGWMIHVYLGIFSPGIYQNFGASALIPAYTAFWNSFVMPNITVFALLLAAFEIAVGCLLSSTGKWVKIGLVFSVVFSLFLIQMGLSDTSPDLWTNFARNRLANILFIGLQLPLFWCTFDKSLPRVIKGWFSKKAAQRS